MVQVLLIYCEGKTEQLYFEMLANRIFRIPMCVRIDIYGKKGQHKALIDRVSAARKELARTEDVQESEVECWAVCDDDNMPSSYKTLSNYAKKHNVNLGFSRPQFEAYLLQHFEQSKATKKGDLFSDLTKYKKPIDGSAYSTSTKGDLEWLERCLFEKPKLVETAITNSDRRRRQSDPLFLTVQELTKRLKQLERR